MPRIVRQRSTHDSTARLIGNSYTPTRIGSSSSKPPGIARSLLTLSIATAIRSRDVNEKNVFVTPTAIVWLLDCDSFQINASGQLYPCEVGMELYTPPELQGQSFRGVVRTHNHDRFGLAVLIFHLLFVGRHPFAGRPLTRGDLSPDKAIKEFRFAYSRAAAQLQIAPPPYAPLLGIVPAEIGRLFERAFSTHSPQPGARPPAQEWATALRALQKQLKTCSKDPGTSIPASQPMLLV